ncbi:hypothetical protein QJS04_geneDACA015187 [Acorus gramineus]|uniref:Peptidoglycan binding-like domain-containing protein n=1 Tax=Acorus gramineus TaxID=55184 RepID=A0AAV9B7N8_ACOGR|nr:hypothetical protein QJS04_geneDACA015187 [Acorus gramineus]
MEIPPPSILSLALTLILTWTIASSHLTPGAWGFLQNLTDCHLGDHIVGLSSLKKCLLRFGYIDSTLNSSNAIDDFDFTLQSTLKAYQTNFNLKPTGVLDTPTITQITCPCCGMPDNINGSILMNYGGLHHRRRLLYSFTGMPKWPSSTMCLNGGDAAIMYLTIMSGMRRVELDKDDVEGVQRLYGRNLNDVGGGGASRSMEMVKPDEEKERSNSRMGWGWTGLTLAGGLILVF